MMELRGLANLGESGKGGWGHLETFIATRLICEPGKNSIQDAVKMRELILWGFFFSTSLHEMGMLHIFF